MTGPAARCGTGKGTDCPNHFGCDSAGTDCNTSCTSSAGCASGYACNAGACVAPTIVGTCTENDDCFTGICSLGLGGSGHCCETVCAAADATCGATDCSPTDGKSNYAEDGTPCGSVAESCSGGTQQNPSVCDGQGTCPAPGTKDCTPFICGPTACSNTCADNSSCGTGAFL